MLSALKSTLIILLVSFILLTLIEGVSSLVISARDAMQGPGLVELSQYDAELGWVDIPNAYAADLYGPGQYVRANSRGFRSDTETDLALAQGIKRIICSGDSFTYGQGVGNDETWCHLLGKARDDLLTLNMGQPGYGIDQMYLRYQRDADDIEHSVHIVAFVNGDFFRMGATAQAGFGKPLLIIEDGQLRPTNIPVPRLRHTIGRWLERANFRAVTFGRRLLDRLGNRYAREADAVEHVKKIAPLVFEELEKIGRKRGARTVFLFLPDENDLRTDMMWRTWINQHMSGKSMQLIDLTEALRELSAGTASSFFIPRGAPAEGHYNEAGNAWVARQLRSELEQRGLLVEADAADP